MRLLFALLDNMAARNLHSSPGRLREMIVARRNPDAIN